MMQPTVDYCTRCKYYHYNYPYNYPCGYCKMKALGYPPTYYTPCRFNYSDNIVTLERENKYEKT